MTTDLKKAELDHKVLPEVKKAIDLFFDKTYEVSDLYSHLLQIIRDETAPSAKDREQLERLMYKVDEMREAQRLYHGGHKSKLHECKRLETAIDKKIMGLQSLGYTFQRFRQVPIKQNELFGG